MNVLKIVEKDGRIAVKGEVSVNALATFIQLLFSKANAEEVAVFRAAAEMGATKDVQSDSIH